MSTRTASMPITRRRRRRSASDRPAPRTEARVQSAEVVDLSRVVEARRRIAAGWYDRMDVRKSLVEAVLQEIRSR